MAKVVYIDKLNNTKIFAERAEYTRAGRNIDSSLDSKLDKLAGATSGNLASFDSNGNIVDSNQAAANLVHDASYVHTDNNYTTTDKNKLSGIAAGAEVNVQSDWTQTSVSADDYIKNKPDNLVQDADYVHTDNNFTTSEKNKLGGIASGAQVNVIETVKVNGTAQTVTSKAVDITVPTGGTSNPSMDGTASPGSATTYSKSDHVHPTDTSREAVANKDSSIPTTPVSGHYPSTVAVANFVNSSISTNTANFLGTYDVASDLGLTTSATNAQIASALNSFTFPTGTTVTNNDYVFVSINYSTTTDIDEFRRFKYSAGTPNGSWAYEYTLNNSSYTQAQWDAINSGATATKVGNYDSHLSNTNNPHSVTAAQVGLGNVGNFKAVSTVAGQGLNSTEQSNARTNIGAGTYTKAVNGIPKTDLASGVQTSLGLADTALQSSDIDSAMSSTSTNPVQNKVVNSALEGKASSTHTHGNIQNGGTLQTTDVTIASGDKLVVTDSSDSNKVARTSVSFDGSTTTKALTQKGTFETFYQKPSGGIPDTDITSASTWNAKQNALATQTAYTTQGSATKVPQITTNSLGQVTGITEVTISHQDISGKENTSNKVSAWSSTTTDTNYPSEKLVKDSLDLKAPLASPTFTGTPKAPTATAGTNTTQIATTAFVKTAVDTAIADVADALVYKGTIAGGSTGSYGALTAAANKGYLYKVSAAGKIDGVKVEVGDMLICNADNTAAATSTNYSTIAASWDFIQTNIEGYVLGPSSSVDAHVATFNGTTGNTIKDSGYTIAASVPSGAVFTDTKVTSSGNHYTPSTASGSDKSASATGATAEWGIDVVKGVTLNTDGKGHVTGISVTSGKIPSNPNTDTKVKATAKTDNVNYKILATASASPDSGNATEAVYDADITLNPSTNTIAANISGDAATASAAKSGSALETAINGKVSTSTTVNGHALSGNVTVTAADVSAVRYDTASQGLSATQKSNARTNIGAGTSNLALGSTSSTAAAGDHTHTTSIATSTGTNQVTLAASTKYAITAGGTSYVFTTPPDTTYSSKTAASGGTDVSLCTTGEKYTWNAKQNALTGQTAYTTQGSATKVPQITTNSLGQVTKIEEVTISGVTPASHAHGNIANDGKLTDTAAAAAGNDYVVIRDADNAKIQTSTIKGTDVADAVSKKHSHSTLTLSTTAQAYDGTHTLALPESDPYSSARTPSSHTHGNIQNGGTLQTSDVTIASGDKLVITDSSDSNKVARASAAFDGSTTTKALTQKGTFETFLQSHQDISGKADKKVPATSGNFAGLDANGNLTDSGKKASDFATSAQGTAANTAVQSVKIGSSSGTELKSGTSVIIPSASTSASGAVQLKDSIGDSETSTTTAATPHAVREAIDTAVASAYHHAGTSTLANLITNASTLLVAANEGNVYNVSSIASTSGKTTSDFIEGAGLPIDVGDNIGICKDGNVYKYDLLSGFVDLSNYKTKQSTVSVSGGALKSVASLGQDANGVVSLTLNDIQSASTSQKGVVQLAGSIGATVDSENNKAASEKAVRDAIDDNTTSLVAGSHITVTTANDSVTIATDIESITNAEIDALFS